MIYTPGRDHDTILELWYHRLRESGDLTKLFLADARGLVCFLNSFQRPTELAFEVNQSRDMQLAMWFDPRPLVGAWCGLWIHADLRRSRTAFRWMMQTYTEALEVWPILYGLTWQAALLEPHADLGYTIAQEIPSAFDGHPGWLVCLTKANFQRSHAYERYTQHRREPIHDAVESK